MGRQGQFVIYTIFYDIFRQFADPADGLGTVSFRNYASFWLYTRAARIAVKPTSRDASGGGRETRQCVPFWATRFFSQDD